MLVLKHVEYEIADFDQLENLVAHLRETTSHIEGVTFKEIYFREDRKEFVLFLECMNQEQYLRWREICPPPPGAKDWYEILLNKKEYFSQRKGPRRS
ncbi:MAG: hypothetical protein GTN81_02020 [Proteobacteria bacterium]|nr:hypothetical protein [Pseudomonadota bacterium]